MTELSFNRKRHFPNLHSDSYLVTSPETGEYNCVAWALGLADGWMEPNDSEGVDPGGQPHYLGWALRILATHGFEQTGDVSIAKDALAVFATDEQFTHIARRLDDGRWTSKLGDWEDIEHVNLECLEGGAYGFVVATLTREPSP